jgi:hypothetical protein
VRLLLDHPVARTTINQRDHDGETELWEACCTGRGGVVRALLESGADPTIADNGGTTPMALAKDTTETTTTWLYGVTFEARRECVAALEVRPDALLPPLRHTLS